MTDEEVQKMSLIIQNRILSLEEYKRCRLLLAYADIRHEAGTSLLVQKALADGKEAALPRIEGRKMVFYKIHSLDELKPGTMGIPEPQGGVPADGEGGLMIMPGVAFDRSLHRIGYGGGFYDRYLSQFTDLTRIAIAFSFQVFDRIPWEETDIDPQMLVTDEEIIYPSC